MAKYGGGFGGGMGNMQAILKQAQQMQQKMHSQKLDCLFAFHCLLKKAKKLLYHQQMVSIIQEHSVIATLRLQFFIFMCYNSAKDILL